MKDNKILEMHNIVKEFSGCEALKGVDFSINKGKLSQLSVHPVPEKVHCFAVLTD